MFDLTFSESEFTLTLDNQVKTLLRRASSLWKHFALKAEKCIFCAVLCIFCAVRHVLDELPHLFFYRLCSVSHRAKSIKKKILSFVFSSPKISWHCPFKAATFQQHILIDKVSNANLWLMFCSEPYSSPGLLPLGQVCEPDLPGGHQRHSGPRDTLRVRYRTK